MTNGWLASPTLSVVVEVIFSLPHFRVASSSLRTGRSMIAVTTTSAFPAASGVPESTPVVASTLSHFGPRASVNLGFSISQKPAAPRPLSLRSPRQRLARTWYWYWAPTLAVTAGLL